jgi:hypothetical protein
MEVQMKPDFNTITIPELKAYVLAHRDDDEAFHKLADRLQAGAEDSELYPAPDTPENIAIMETAIREHVQRLEKKRQG